jgi:hypothetical protein
MTADQSLVGEYKFKVKVTELSSGLINEANQFTCSLVLPDKATDIVLISGT